MKNVIKSQFYQLSKQTLLYIVLFILLIVVTAFCLLFGRIDADFMGIDPTASDTFKNYSTIFSLMTMAFTAIAVPTICGGDLKDKTANHEILSGHVRKDVYFGRTVVAIIVSIIGWVGLSIIPVVVLTAVYGWGNAFTVAELAVRYIFSLLPLIRIVCELVFATFIIKTPYIVMAVAYIVTMLITTLSSYAPDSVYFFGMSAFSEFYVIESTAMYGLNEGVYYVCDASLSSELVIMTVIVSTIVGLGSLIAGYRFFKNDDIN